MIIERKNNLKNQICFDFNVCYYNQVLNVNEIDYKVWDQVWIQIFVRVADQICIETRNPILNQVYYKFAKNLQ